jgi:hypothetical protein
MNYKYKESLRTNWHNLLQIYKKLYFQKKTNEKFSLIGIHIFDILEHKNFVVKVSVFIFLFIIFLWSNFIWYQFSSKVNRLSSITYGYY